MWKYVAIRMFNLPWRAIIVAPVGGASDLMAPFG
jgi:hypothetical protein